MDTRPVIGIPTQTLQAIDGIPDELPLSWVMNHRYYVAVAEMGGGDTERHRSAGGEIMADGVAAGQVEIAASLLARSKLLVIGAELREQQGMSGLLLGVEA